MVNPPIRVQLQTTGRKSGQTHTVRITAVMYDGDYYFSRHRPDSDWFLNAMYDPNVIIHLDQNHTIQGLAEQVRDESRINLISHIKYPNDARAKERRVAIKVTPISTT